jgi:hypothetical protein
VWAATTTAPRMLQCLLAELLCAPPNLDVSLSTRKFRLSVVRLVFRNHCCRVHCSFN